MKQVVEIRQGMNHLFFMNASTDPPPLTLDDLRKTLAQKVQDASPEVARLAEWALDHPQEMAFHSVRALAKRADVNANTVFRLAVALGFSGYDPCRRAFQAALRDRGGMYGSRAQQLRSEADGDGLTDRIRASAHANVDALFDGENHARIGQAVDMLMAARRIHTVGVRSCFSLAHYLAYTGRMAFDSFAPPLNEPGGIADAITETGPEDVVIPITFSLYSAEVVRAHDTARARGAKIIAITDSYASPVARDADLVFCLPMAGPQPLPSQGAAFALAEVLVGHMIAHCDHAAKRIADYEARMLEFGAYMQAGSPR